MVSVLVSVRFGIPCDLLHLDAMGLIVKSLIYGTMHLDALRCARNG